MPKLRRTLGACNRNFIAFFRRHIIGLLVITGTTLIFFGPLLPHIATYSEGGDAMFNAWTLARDQHCILQQGCPTYTDGNIYFPNKDSMLYSETQLSAGLLTLPLHFINNNPIFSYNMWTIISMFLSGFFMYVLARFLSKKNETIAIAAGLIFEFAPIKMTGLGHLQNLSIFYLPLIVYLCLKIIQTKKARKLHIVALFVSMVLLFYASWYQMVFALIAIGSLLIGLLIFRLIDFRKAAILCIVTILAVLSTLPLAKEYVRFSKTNQATFSIGEQALFSSSLKDYFIPYSGTIEGNAYIQLRPNAKINGYNPDSSSYHGFGLYLACFIILLLAITKLGKKVFTKKEKKLLYTFCIIGVVGFVLSLGPLLKIGADYAYTIPNITEKALLPLPYILIDKFLPQLSFIRAIGRVSIVVLFALCCVLALGARFLPLWPRKTRIAITSIFIIIAFIELAPRAIYAISPNSFSKNLTIPKVYEFIDHHPEINNLVILRSDKDYPNAAIPIIRAEDTLWAGYHNRNIFNGYSGYEPKNYKVTYDDFVDFHNDDIAKMKKNNLKYIILDKQLSHDGTFVDNVTSAPITKIYEDNRYILFKL